MANPKLIEALQSCCVLLSRSEASAWVKRSPEDIFRELQEHILTLQAGRSIEKRYLSTWFAPTGDIQEIALVSGWHNKYVDIATIIELEEENGL